MRELIYKHWTYWSGPGKEFSTGRVTGSSYRLSNVLIVIDHISLVVTDAIGAW